MPALAPNSLIVITGITGYIAAHVGLQALQLGHRVRGTVRSLAKADAVRQAYAKHGISVTPDRLEFAILDDLKDQAQFERSIKGANGVIHVALPEMSMSWVDDMTASVLAVLRAAAKEPSVKRVVLTSSAVTTHITGQSVGHVLTGKDWNELAVQKYKNATEEDKKDHKFMHLLYFAAKTISEQAAWKWMEDNKPSFDFATIIPFANFGPVLVGDVRPGPASTAGWLVKLLKNDDSDIRVLPPHWYVDVRDDAKLHILALMTPEAGGQRIWAAAGPFGWDQLLAILREKFPDMKVPEDVPSGATSTQEIDSEFARMILGGSWIPLEQSAVDTATSAGY